MRISLFGRLNIFAVLMMLTGTAAQAATGEVLTPEQSLERRLEWTRERLKQAAIQREVYKAQIEVAALRSLPVKEPVAYELLTPETMDRIVVDTLARQYPGKSLELWGWVNALFGSQPTDLDLRELYLRLMREQAAGLYDPLSKTFYVSPQFQLDSTLGRLVLAHEITHALQDQNYELVEMGVEAEGDSDRALAALSVAEGDATLLMSEYTVRHGNPVSMLKDIPAMLAIDQTELNAAPEVIRQSLLFPYLSGMAFFQALAGRTAANPGGGRSYMLDSAWRNEVFEAPPISTEQIIHPEKYLAGEKPESVAPPRGPAAAHEAFDVFGEFGIRLQLGITVGEKRAAQAAAGWNGDRLRVAMDESGQTHWLDWTTRWDTEADAEEFESALEETLAKRMETLRANNPGGGGNEIKIERPEPKTVTLSALFINLF